MNLLVDGIIFQNQTQGGISRIYSEILPRMSDIESELSVELLTSGVLKQPVPVHEQIRHARFLSLERLFPGRWFYRFRRKIRAFSQLYKLSGHDGYIWHSTYFTRPLYWHGPIVLTLPDMLYEQFPELFSRPIDQAIREHRRNCIQEADAIICITHSTRNDLLNYYDIPLEKLHVVHLACNDIFQQLPIGKNRREKPFLLYVGGRQHYKNFQRLLQAYATWEMRQEINLLVVGAPWTSKEKELLAQLDLNLHVELMSGVSDNKLSLLYNEAAAFVYPSLYEGFGLPLLEAMSCGCPVVASRIPSSVEVAADSAFYFDPENNDDMQSALSAALSCGRGSEKVHRGLKRASLFSWDKCAIQTLAVYRQLNDK